MGRYHQYTYATLARKTNLLLGLTLSSLLGALLLLGLALFEQSLRDEDLVLSRDAPTVALLVGPLEHTTRWLYSSERRTAAQWLLALMHSPLSTL